MKRQSIYTENDSYKSAYDSWEKLTPSVTKAPSAPIPSTFKPWNISTRHSGAFNDFNKQFRDKRQIPGENKFRLKNFMGGNNAKGLYKQDQEDYFMKDETLKIKYKMRKEKRMEVDRDELATQEQRTTEGAEIRGQVQLNERKARAEINLIERTKRNRGGWNAGKDAGAFQAGFDYTGYNATQVKKDNEFKKLNAQQDEFRSIVEGEMMNSGGNANIVQQPE